MKIDLAKTSQRKTRVGGHKQAAVSPHELGSVDCSSCVTRKHKRFFMLAGEGVKACTGQWQSQAEEASSPQEATPSGDSTIPLMLVKIYS